VKIDQKLAIIISLFAGFLLFIPFLGGVHLFDWDEINFAESAREMLVTGDFLTVRINYEPFWEKPPLFFWLQVLSVKLFGENEFAMRFPNAIAGIFTLFVLFRTGRRIMDEKFGLIWMLVYAGSILPFFYFKSGIIDPWFNLFIFIGISHFAYYFIFQEGRIKNLILSALFFGLAVLTKGPVAVLILILTFGVYMLIKKFRIQTSLRDVLIFFTVLLFTGGIWFLLQVLSGNLHIVQDFIEYQVRLFRTRDAGHGGFFLYHFVVLLIGVFPASIFAIPALRKTTMETYRPLSFALWMKILFWVVLILFTIVKTKIVHYSSLCYFPLTFLATQVIYQIQRDKMPFYGILRALIIFIASVYTLLTLLIPLIGKFADPEKLSGLIDDPFVIANLQANVYWSGLEALTGILFLTGLILTISLVKKQIIRIAGIFLITLLFTYSTILVFTPKIEAYSQRAAIEFYKTLDDRDVYVTTLGFKSYAHLYYSKVQPYSDDRAVEQEWLLEGDTDKPVYIVFKIQRKERYLTEYPQLELLYEKNGFVFTKVNHDKK
jgi:4-amino-4-deoxy-L-arabinose transferase-like glycosyltransferase